MSDLVADHWWEDTKMVLNTCCYLLSVHLFWFQLYTNPCDVVVLLFTLGMGIAAGHHVTWWLTFTINYLLGKYLCFSCCNWNFLMLLPLFQHLHFSWLLNNFEAWWKIWCNRSIALHLLPLNYSIKVSSSSERILLNLKI